MALLVVGALAALVAILAALTGSSAARRMLAGMVALMAAAFLAMWLFQNR